MRPQQPGLGLGFGLFVGLGFIAMMDSPIEKAAPFLRRLYGGMGKHPTAQNTQTIRLVA
jgi:hypothetical protein